MRTHATLRTAGILLATAAMVLFTLSGCGEKEVNDYYAKVDDDGTITYSTETSTDPYNYTMYVNKELALVANILNTHVATGDNILKQKYIIKDEIRNVKNDLDMVSEAITSVETLMPPNEYEDDREAILSRMVNAQSSLQAYLDILESNTQDGLEDIIDLMESDYIALTGSFNIIWE